MFGKQSRRGGFTAADSARKPDNHDLIKAPWRKGANLKQDSAKIVSLPLEPDHSLGLLGVAR